MGERVAGGWVRGIARNLTVPESDTNLVQPPAASADEPSTRRAWTLVAFMWVAYVLNYTDRQVVFSIFPVLKSELQFTDTQLGLTGSIFLWVYSLCSPITGQIGDRFSKRFLVVLSLVLWSAVTALTGLANSVGTLLFLRAMIGVSESLFMPAALALTVSAHGPQTRSRALAVLATAQLAGVVMGGWFGGFMAEHVHWRAAFYSLGIIGILYAIPYRSFLSRTSETAAVETKKSGGGLAIATLVRIPSYLFVCAVFAGFNFVLWLLYTWLPTFFYEKFSLTLADAGFTATIYLQGATFVGLLCGGTLADWLYTRTKAARFWIISAGLFLVAPCVHLIGHCESLLFAKLAALGCGLGCGFAIANLVASSYEVVPADTRASAAGCLNLVAFIAGFASLMGGVWKQSVGISTMMSYGSLVCITAGLLLIVCIKLVFQEDYDRVH
jgi:predicted MFS family arabinose efflux permease